MVHKIWWQTRAALRPPAALLVLPHPTPGLALGAAALGLAAAALGLGAALGLAAAALGLGAALGLAAAAFFTAAGLATAFLTGLFLGAACSTEDSSGAAGGVGERVACAPRHRLLLGPLWHKLQSSSEAEGVRQAQNCEQ